MSALVRLGGVDPEVFGKVSSLSPLMSRAGCPCTLRFHVQGACVARIGGGDRTGARKVSVQ